MADEGVSKNSGGRRIGVIDIDTQSIHYPQDFLKATSAGPDLGPLGNAIKRTGEGVLAISILASCAPAADIIPTPTKEAGQPHMGAIFETYNFTEFYKTDPSVTDLMAQLEEENGTFDQSWSLNSIQSEKSVNTVQFFGFEEAHVVGFWTMGANKEPLLLKENIQPIKGRYVYDNASGALTYELMVNGTDTAVSQTFLKMSVESNSLISLDSLVMSANSGDADAQAKLTDMLSSNKGNFTIELTNLASGRTDIGTLSPNQMTEVPPTALPSQPSLLDRIMAMGVTPVSALGVEPAVQAATTPMLTFEQQVATAEFVTPTMYTEVVGQYAKAYGLEIGNVQLHTETSIINGKPVAFQVDQNGVPLFILNSHDGESKWEYFNLPTAGNLVHIRWGSTTNEGEAFTDNTYINLLQNEFQIISPIDPTILDINTVLKDPYYGSFVENLAKTHDFRLYNLFWHADHRQAGSSEPNLTDPIWEGAPRIGQQASPEYQAKIRNYMAEKAKLVIHDNPSMTELGFANEAFSADDSGWFGWEDSPYYRAFGDRWLIEAYVSTYNTVLQSGKVPGKDIKLFYSDYNFELPGNKSNHVYDEMQRLRVEVAKQLNLNPSDLPLVIDMQMHINFEPNVPPGEFNGNKLTEEKLLQNLAKFANVGEVFIGEMTIKGGTPEQKQEALLTVIRAAVKSKNVDSIVFWDLLRNGGYWEGGKLLFNVDDNSYSRTKSYFELLKTIKTLAESGD